MARNRFEDRGGVEHALTARAPPFAKEQTPHSALLLPCTSRAPAITEVPRSDPISDPSLATVDQRPGTGSMSPGSVAFARFPQGVVRVALRRARRSAYARVFSLDLQGVTLLAPAAFSSSDVRRGDPCHGWGRGRRRSDEVEPSVMTSWKAPKAIHALSRTSLTSASACGGRHGGRARPSISSAITFVDAGPPATSIRSSAADEVRSPTGAYGDASPATTRIPRGLRRPAR